MKPFTSYANSKHTLPGETDAGQSCWPCPETPANPCPKARDRTCHLQSTGHHPGRHRKSSSSWCLLLILFSLVSQGCSGRTDGLPRGSVRGIIQLDGTPIEQGHISFYPIRDTKGPVVGGTISAGKYSLSSSTGPVIGWNRMEISWKRKTGRKVPAGPPRPAGSMVDEITEAVPAKYNTESTLEHEVKAGKNVFDLDLLSEQPGKVQTP